MAMPKEASPLPDDPNRDLGFGSVVSRESRKRMLNRDGSFNVKKEGMSPLTSLSLYHSLLTMSWPHFLGLVVVAYLALNAAFALAFLACGPGAIGGAGVEASGGSEFLRAFFFSVQTFATIGYGHMNPASVAANFLVTFESLFGLLGFALATGLLFSRFSRPTAKVLFSRFAIIAPYHDVTAFEFRIVNARSNQLIEVKATVMVTMLQDGEAKRRDFFALKLERPGVVFFPLAWTVVHPIDEASPLHGLTYEDLKRSDAEFLVLLSGIDETFAQAVHSRTSYKTDELVWGARFSNLFKPMREDGMVSIDIGRLDEVERTPLPA